MFLWYFHVVLSGLREIQDYARGQWFSLQNFQKNIKTIFENMLTNLRIDRSGRKNREPRFGIVCFPGGARGARFPRLADVRERVVMANFESAGGRTFFAWKSILCLGLEEPQTHKQKGSSKFRGRDFKSSDKSLEWVFWFGNAVFALNIQFSLV